MNTFGTFNASEEALAREMWEFRTCQRSDGSYYGTGGQCRKGTETDKPEKDKTKEGFSKKELRKASDAKIKQLSGAMSNDDPLKKDLDAELARREQAKKISTRDMKVITDNISGRSQGDGMLYDEGGDPGKSFSKMSEKELKAYVKKEVEYSFGKDTDNKEYLMESLREENPRIAKKLEAAIKANGGDFPVESVSNLKVYYSDPSDKSVYPGLKGKVNGVPFNMPPGVDNFKSEPEQRHGFYLGGIADAL